MRCIDDWELVAPSDQAAWGLFLFMLHKESGVRIRNQN